MALNHCVNALKQDSSSYSMEEQIPVQRFMSILEKFAGCDKDRTKKER
jgi:hypothetical protein